MQNPPKTIFACFAASLEADDAFQIFIVVCEEHVARLIADFLDLSQAEVSRITSAAHAFNVVENIPVRSVPVFLGELMTTDNHLHPKPLGFADVQHERADRMSSQKSRLA